MNRIIQTTILILIIFTLSSQSSSLDPFDLYIKTSQYDSILIDNFENNKIPGLAIAIVHNGSVFYKKTMGYTNVKTLQPINDSTVFRLASLSKGISSAVTGISVEKKLINWDDRVNKYLNDFKLYDIDATNNLTLTHLLSQTSGLPSYAGTELLENNISFSQLVENLSTIPLLNMPGKHYNYQNVVFSLIGNVLSKATNKSFDELVWDEIFNPLQMLNASIGMDDFKNEINRALPHIKLDSVWVPTHVKLSYYNIPPAAGINASILDMIQWTKAMLGYYPDILTDYVRFNISTPYIETDKSARYFNNWENLGKTYYGLGWRIFEFGDTVLIYHGGYVQGFRAEIALDYFRDIGFIVLMNAATPFADNCVPLFFNLFIDPN